MIREDFNYQSHGFTGHLAEPEEGSDRAVVIIMGGEQSLLPGIKIAERFADYGITGLAVSLYGADGLPESPNQIPIDMFIPAIQYLREVKHIEKLSVYGQSMGSIFAVLVAQYIGGFENLIMVSPTHVPFEGTLKDKKTMSGHSVATWHGEDIPFVRADLSKVKATKYQNHPDAKSRVTGMWAAYHDAYQDLAAVEQARLHAEETHARILLIAGDEDECWPAEYSVREIERSLKEAHYDNDVKTIIYHHGSHLNGLMPNRQREKKLYRMIPLIGVMYRTFGRYRQENLRYFEESEQEIINWIRR
ncbi:MAG: alpha/beta hydrolase [Solobacterium sp.]|nr:alpha/beta hydrolase [Solobacterium sp.]